MNELAEQNRICQLHYSHLEDDYYVDYDSGDGGMNEFFCLEFFIIFHIFLFISIY